MINRINLKLYFPRKFGGYFSIEFEANSSRLVSCKNNSEFFFLMKSSNSFFVNYDDLEGLVNGIVVLVIKTTRAL